MSKGITPVIAIILLLLITISIVGFAFIFFQRTTETASQSGQEQLQQQISQAGTKLRIESVDKNKVYIRNLGSKDLGNLAFFVSGVKIGTDNPTIPPNTVATVTLNNAQLAMLPDPAELRVTSGGLSDKITANFYSANTVAYWTFDEADRTNVKDQSGNGNDGTFVTGAEGWRDGTLVNGPAAITGKYGNALDFAAGVDDYVEIADHTSLDFGTGAFTISAWIYVDSFASQFVIFYKETGNFGNANTIGYNLHVSTGGTLSIELTNSGPTQRVSCGGCITTGRWYHVVGVSNGANSKVYIDGVDRTTSNDITGTVNTNSGVTALIGSGRDVAHQADGKIDEVRIYNRALSATEVAEDMNSPYPIARTAASYSFEKIESNTAFDTHNIVKGKYGAAMSFDGVDDYIDLGTTNKFLEGANKLTIESWIKSNVATDTVIFTSNKVVGHEYLLLAPTIDNKLRLWVAPLGDNNYRQFVTNNPIIIIGDFQHVAGVWNGSNTLTLYLNGKEQASSGTVTIGSIAGLTFNHGLGLNNQYIGRYANRADIIAFNGIIDEVRILNVARS